jgi:hypothetical protein
MWHLARMKILLAAVLALPLLAACTASGLHCPICYEDEWSRDPFPGQPTQEIPTPDPKVPPAHELNPADIPN